MSAPKAVRRSKEEREKIENDEKKKRNDEARAALREQRRAGRGRGDFKGDRGRGGKARGGFMGDGERGIREQVASGPFSAGQVSAEGSYKRRPPGGGFGGGGFGGGGGGGSGGVRVKSEGGGAYGGSHAVKTEDGGYISSDADEGNEGPRQDIDIIDISDDEGEGGGSGSGGGGQSQGQGQGASRGMIPIRVSRVEHRERDKPVIADSAKPRDIPNDSSQEAGIDPSAVVSGKRTPSPTAVRKGKQRAKELEVTGTQRKWRGAWSDGEDSEPETRIKPEPTDDHTDPMTAQPMDTHPPIKESESPDSRRKSAKTRASRHALPTAAPTHQTAEEKREWERHHLDLEIIRQELGELVIPPAPKPPADTFPEAAPDTEVDTEMADARDGLAEDKDGEKDGSKEGEAAQQPVADRRADRVYLFQFPPILPDLLVGPSTVKKEAPPSPELSRRTKPNIVAGENNTDDTAIDLEDIPDISTATATNDVPNANAGANTQQNPVKVEELPDMPASAGQIPNHPLPSGLVGKLRVHASGRVTLDWGGTSMQVGMGTDVQFLQDVMVTRFFQQEEKLEDLAGDRRQKQTQVKREEDRDEEKGPGGEVMGLGQVRGKFVVTPDWEEIVGQRI